MQIRVPRLLPWPPTLKFGGLRLSPSRSRGEGRSAHRACWVCGRLKLEFWPRVGFDPRVKRLYGCSDKQI
eukprot:12887061-Alexandrium_andersonii.AAC.1